MVYLKYIVLILCALLAISGKQVYKEFGNITYEQLLFHLQVPFILDGINLKSVIKMVVLTYGLPCIGLLLSWFVVEKFLLKRKMFQNLFYTFLLLGCLGVSQFYWHFDRLFQEMQQTRIYGDFYEKHYIQPQAKNLIFPQEKRNLIVIVLESMEKTFSPHSPTTQDSSNSSKLLSPFGNLTPNLAKLSQSHISFKDPLGGGTTIFWCKLEHCRISRLLLLDSSKTPY